VITLKNITVEFENHKVLEKLSVSFEDGKKYSIMGQSGCGKTTILNVIAGLLKSKDGNVSTYGAKIAYVFQEPRLYDWMNVLENVAVVSSLPKKNAEKKSAEILSSLGLGESLKQFPAELSGGMKQRVSIARAMAYDPDIILLDEPFKALDAVTRKQTAEAFFKAMNDKTIIIVTHDIEDTLYTENIAIIEKVPVSSLIWQKVTR